MASRSERKSLRTGFSTGAAASAAAGAALSLALGGELPRMVELELPQGGRLSVPVDTGGVDGPGLAWATVIKDGGDDPDATHKARVTSRVLAARAADRPQVEFRGGPGVGRVTRPGLPIPPGEPAINPVPRQMIAHALERVWAARGPGGPLAATVEVSVADGEQIARRTLNPRLGILGGISILGTTGLVKPFSHEAYTATIDSALKVARAAGQTEAVFTTGGRSEKRAQALRPDLPDLCFVQIADFFDYALGRARDERLAAVGLVSFFGKAVKQAAGHDYTHAHRAAMDLEALAARLAEGGADPELVAGVAAANTARHALEIMRERGALGMVGLVGLDLGLQARSRLGSGPKLWVVVLDYDGQVLFRLEEPGGAA